MIELHTSFYHYKIIFLKKRKKDVKCTCFSKKKLFKSILFQLKW